MSKDERARIAMQLLDRIEPLLAGRGPDVQGAVISQLAVKWISGFHPAAVREQVLALHIATLRAELAILRANRKQ